MYAGPAYMGMDGNRIRSEADDMRYIDYLTQRGQGR
jgi:hypothetical protein